MWAGYLGAALLWYVCVRWAPFEAFRRLPDPVAVLAEWLSPQPTYGISIFTGAYYKHMLYSTLRASAAFLGGSRRDILLDVVLPGALPSIFTGLQIAMGAAWFSLAAGEMIAAQYGLGFLIMESYNLIQFPTIVIAMATLGLLGYASSALIRLVGERLMRWRAQNIGFAQ